MYDIEISPIQIAWWRIQGVSVERYVYLNFRIMGNVIRAEAERGRERDRYLWRQERQLGIREREVKEKEIAQDDD